MLSLEFGNTLVPVHKKNNHKRVMPDLEVSSSTQTAPLLPPCRVCGEKASGFHYGANTCEACKGFFRRSLQRQTEYNCPFEGSCDILPGKRNICAACRYKKCVAVGMSKTAIKTGRYTHEKKTRDIEEVKRLELQKKMKIEPALSLSPNDVQTREQELENIIKHITNIHQQQTPHTPEFFEKLPEREAKFLERRALQQEMFGTMKPIPKDEYMQIYQTTGIDIDGRREMITHMIPCIEKAIKRFIAFAKALPGFKDLPIDDQIALIKASRFEAWLIASHKAFNVEHMLYTHACGYTLHAEEIASTMQDNKYLLGMFRVSQRMQRLELTQEEECVFRSLCVLSRDRCTLSNPDLVEECQNTMLKAMEYLIRKNHPNSKFMMAKLILIMTEMRSLNNLNKNFEEKLGTEWSDIKFPPLVCEMCSASRYEVWMTSAHRTFNIKEKLVTTVNGDVIDFEKLCLLHDDNYLVSAFKIAERFQEFNFTLEEICVLRAFVVLFRASRFEVWMTGAHRVFNLDKNIVTTINGEVFHFEELSKMHDEDYIKTAFRVAAQFQTFNLCDEEMCVLRAFLVLFRDRVPLKNPDKVEECQEVLLEALTYLFKKNHPEEKHMLAKMILFLTDLRTATETHAKQEEKLSVEWSEDIQFPPLLLEMWST